METETDHYFQQHTFIFLAKLTTFCIGSSHFLSFIYFSLLMYPVLVINKHIYSMNNLTLARTSRPQSLMSSQNLSRSTSHLFIWSWVKMLDVQHGYEQPYYIFCSLPLSIVPLSTKANMQQYTCLKWTDPFIQQPRMCVKKGRLKSGFEIIKLFIEKNKI